MTTIYHRSPRGNVSPLDAASYAADVLAREYARLRRLVNVDPTAREWRLLPILSRNLGTFTANRARLTPGGLA